MISENPQGWMESFVAQNGNKIGGGEVGRHGSVVCRGREGSESLNMHMARRASGAWPGIERR